MPSRSPWNAAEVGRLVYEAYWASWGATLLPWERLPRRERLAWQHAAWQLLQDLGLVPRTSRGPRSRASRAGEAS